MGDYKYPLTGFLLAALCSAPAFAVEPITLTAVAHFGTGKAALQSRDQSQLLAEVAKMKDVTWQSITVTGHADSTGDAQKNQELSVKRARAVKAYFVGKGLEAGMITADGFGSDKAVGDNATAKGRAANRRAEVVYQGVKP